MAVCRPGMALAATAGAVAPGKAICQSNNRIWRCGDRGPDARRLAHPGRQPVMRALRTLAPTRLTDARSAAGSARIRRAAFTIALFAVILEFLLSGNTLELMGIKYASVGGNPLVKLHPATYLAGIACFMVLFMARPAGSGLVRFFRTTPALATYTVLILFCAFYSILNVGFSGAAVYVESYLASALLAVALEAATDRQQRGLAWWII